jgi:hypothetical protein
MAADIELTLRRLCAELLRSRHAPHVVRVAAAVVYGTCAGLLLHDRPYVAAVAMVAIWLAALFAGAGSRAGASGERLAAVRPEEEDEER